MLRSTSLCPSGRATARSPSRRSTSLHEARLRACRLRRLRRDRRGPGVPRAGPAGRVQRRAARGQPRPPPRRPAEEHKSSARPSACSPPRKRRLTADATATVRSRSSAWTPSTRHRRSRLARRTRSPRGSSTRTTTGRLPRQPGLLPALGRLGGAGKALKGTVDEDLMEPALVRVACRSSPDDTQGGGPGRGRLRADQRSGPRPRHLNVMAKQASAEARSARSPSRTRSSTTLT